MINHQIQSNNLNTIIAKLGNLSVINTIAEKPASSFSFMVKSNEFFIPIGNTIDVTFELEKLQKELDYNKGFLKSVESKLNNERFINSAPKQVIANEKNKLADTKAKIEILENKIKDLV